jgi:hypothetical protein
VGGADSIQRDCQGGVLNRIQDGNQVVELEDKANPAPAQFGQIFIGETIERLAIDHNRSFSGTVQSTQ